MAATKLENTLDLEDAFKLADSDSDHVLNEKELLVVAKQLGLFLGSDAEWPEAYKSLQAKEQFAAEGMDMETFNQGLRAWISSTGLAEDVLDEFLKAPERDIEKDVVLEGPSTSENANAPAVPKVEVADADADAEVPSVPHQKVPRAMPAPPPGRAPGDAEPCRVAAPR